MYIKLYHSSSNICNIYVIMATSFTGGQELTHKLYMCVRDLKYILVDKILKYDCCLQELSSQWPVFPTWFNFNPSMDK